jgi:hypothetical protein
MEQICFTLPNFMTILSEYNLMILDLMDDVVTLTNLQKT